MEIKIRHGVFGGVNTARLEERMRAVDWQQHPGNWFFSLDDPADLHLKEMRSIEKEMDDIFRQDDSAPASDTWELLMLKYFSDTPLEYAISQNVPYLEASFTEYHQLKNKSMEATVNFYELRTRLFGLGFTEPHLADQLREAMLSEYDYASLYTDRDNVRIQINLDKDYRGNFQFETYDAILTTNGQLRDQVFAADVPVHEAIELLNDRLTRPDVTAAIAGDPMNRQHVRVSLGLSPNEKNIHESKSDTMNTENLSYLQKQLLNMGFGDKLNEELEKQVKDKKPEFTLQTTQAYNKQNVDYTLHYKAGEQNEMYFFNKYDASLQGKEMAHTFYINKGSGITAKEAYNLMDGRAVHKQLENLENEKYNAWIVIDKENKADNGNYKLRTFTDGWNYKPERAIDKLDIVGINEDGAREKLMKSLEKGNRHQVTAIKDGKEVKLFLEANPAEHRVNLTNWKGEPQQLEHYKKPELKAEQKNNQKQAQNEEGAPVKKSRKSAKMKV